MPMRVQFIVMILATCLSMEVAATRPEEREETSHAMAADDETSQAMSTGVATLQLDADEMDLVASGLKSIVTKTEWGMCSDVCGHRKCRNGGCKCNCPGWKRDGQYDCPHSC
mmetsp:Transcript_49147/g.90690  ORF Transcript_49147/g.90690 Transcript_49147/m.90690 type:complete len:112 (-) Transcript_49147:129-464(-)